MLNLGGRPVIRPDSTYFFNHAPRSDLVFEGQIAPRIIILDSIADAAGRVLSGGAHWGWQLSTTPMVKLRMFDETSSPVRTPSYMPKGTVQLVRMRNLSRADEDDEAERYKGPVEMWLIDVIPFGHHSNGQNGCLFTQQSRNAEGECVNVAGATPANGQQDRWKLLHQLHRGGLFYGRMHLASRADAPEYATAWEWRIGGGIRAEPERLSRRGHRRRADGPLWPDQILCGKHGRAARLSGGAAARRRSFSSSTSRTRPRVCQP